MGMNKAAGADIWSRPGESTIARIVSLSHCARRLLSHVFPAEPSIKIGSQALIHVPPVGEC